MTFFECFYQYTKLRELFLNFNFYTRGYLTFNSIEFDGIKICWTFFKQQFVEQYVGISDILNFIQFIG